MSVDRQKVSNWWFSLNSIQRSLLLSLLIHMLVALGILLGAFPVVEKMMAAVGKTAWDSTRWVQWSFAGKHHYLWDKNRNLVKINWEDF